MNMMRRLIVILSVVLFTIGIAGCSSCKNNEEEKEPQTGYVQTITLKNEQIIVGLYMTDTIEYKAEGEATYSSDNPEIVSVDEKGKVTGLKVGKANVTVAIGEAKGELKGRAAEIVETGYEFGISESDILKRLQQKLEIPLQVAQEYLKIFGKQTV